MAQETETTKLNHVALWSMISGIAGLTIWWMIPIPWSIAAVVLGHIGLSQVKKGQGRGRGFAITGLVTGYVGVGIVVILIGLFASAFAVLGFDGMMNMIQNFRDMGGMDHGYGTFDMPGMMNP